MYSSAASKTDVGLVREHNEDSVIFFQPRDLHLFNKKGSLAVVADGVGGNNAGEVASSLAISTVQQQYYGDLDTNSVSKSLERAIKEANHQIVEASSRNPDYNGMATTCTALVLRQGEAVIAHVGDSRAYMYQGNQLVRLTQDHTLVNDLLKKGHISEDQAKYHPQANVITRALGSNDDVEVDILELPTEIGDSFLLCTDGLSNLVSDEEIASILSSSTPDVSCDTLVDLARHRGGYDNITVQVVKVTSRASESVTKTREIRRSFPNVRTSWQSIVFYLLLLGAVSTSVLFGFSTWLGGALSDVPVIAWEFVAKTIRQLFVVGG